MRIMGEQRHHQQQRRGPQDEADDIMEAVRLILRCFFARHVPRLIPPVLVSKGKLRRQTTRLGTFRPLLRLMSVRAVLARDDDDNAIPKNMKTKIFFALIVAAAMAACRLQAQGTLIAAATITETGTSGSEFMYSLTLTNEGSNPINAFWYGWTVGSFNLPSVPTSLAGPTGWTASALSESVQFGNSTGSAIAPGATGTFTFESTSSPTALTTGTHDGDPTGESVAYATVAAMKAFEQSVAGVASGAFVPTLQTVMVPVPNFQTPAVVDGSVLLSWTAMAGVAYQVQYITNLTQTNWINLGGTITATNNPATTNDLIGTNSMRFYRVVASP
jgi:hypothetical protein